MVLRASALTFTLFAASIVAAPTFASQDAATETTLEARLPQRVLFAGTPDCERTHAFVALLEEHFVAVEATDYRTYLPAAADGFDVVVLDWDVHPTETSMGLARMEQALPADYDRATVLIGGAGVFAVEPLETKLDWL